MCDACYERDRRAARRKSRSKPPSVICSKCSAVATHPVVKLCGRHYDEQKRRRAGIMPKVKFTRTCDEKGCNRPHASRGMCVMHYHRWLRAYHTGNPIYRRAAELPKKIRRGIWTDDGETVTLCWPPRDAGPGWTCPHSSHQEEP